VTFGAEHRQLIAEHGHGNQLLDRQAAEGCNHPGAIGFKNGERSILQCCVAVAPAVEADGAGDAGSNHVVGAFELGLALPVGGVPEEREFWVAVGLGADQGAAVGGGGHVVEPRPAQTEPLRRLVGRAGVDQVGPHPLVVAPAGEQEMLAQDQRALAGPVGREAGRLFDGDLVRRGPDHRRVVKQHQVSRLVLARPADPPGVVGHRALNHPRVLAALEHDQVIPVFPAWASGGLEPHAADGVDVPRAVFETGLPEQRSRLQLVQTIEDGRILVFASGKHLARGVRGQVDQVVDRQFEPGAAAGIDGQPVRLVCRVAVEVARGGREQRVGLLRRRGGPWGQFGKLPAWRFRGVEGRRRDQSQECGEQHGTDRPRHKPCGDRIPVHLSVTQIELLGPGKRWHPPFLRSTRRAFQEKGGCHPFREDAWARSAWESGRSSSGCEASCAFVSAVSGGGDLIQ